MTERAWRSVARQVLFTGRSGAWRGELAPGMEHSVGVSQLDLVRPWRRATYIAGAVAVSSSCSC